MKTLQLFILQLAALLGLRRTHLSTANAEGTAGTHDAALSRLTSAAITTRHLLYKQGADADHIAVVSAATDTPLGTIADEAAGAEEWKAVKLIGRGPTKRMVANGAIAAGVSVFVAAAGKIANAGTVAVGQSLTAAAADGDVIEVNDR